MKRERSSGWRVTAWGRLFVWLGLAAMLTSAGRAADVLAREFRHPPASARPWVYWFWMDGNLSGPGITGDLEAMKRAGLGGVIIMEVDVGIPRGPVHFMSPEWRRLFGHVVREAARLGLQIDLNAGPGWTGSGGPWIRPEQSMQQLTFSETNVVGPGPLVATLPRPPIKEGWYRDVAVLAFPTPRGAARLPGVREKALFARGHYSSEAGVPERVLASAAPEEVPADQAIERGALVDLTARLGADGRLTWDVPAGAWTVMRFGHTSTGANTRPAPEPGIGLECDKMDPAALEAHVAAFVDPLRAEAGPAARRTWVGLHIDSWEMGPQNWTARFPTEFRNRRGYDATPWLPAMAGRIVGSVALTERFLWDVRQTAQELIAANYAGHLRELARRRGLWLSIEPYDGTPCDDLTYGARAEVPMAEFWSNCFDTFFSCAEATSIAHTYGRRVVAAEAFTADDSERWQYHPARLKGLGDWAFVEGINRLVIHRYAHQPWLDRSPGMTMGPYGVHHERTQTWWDLADGWHEYLARCQALLQSGTFVADVCYLMPEAGPQIFRSPETRAKGVPPERPGHNFDATTPEALLTRASVREGMLRLQDGPAYRLLVLPRVETMTPALLRRIRDLVREGVILVGDPPQCSPSLSDFPACDTEVRELARELWGDVTDVVTSTTAPRAVGKGRVFRSPAVDTGTQPASAALEAARWIWHAEGQPAASAPVGTRAFRRPLDLPDDGVKSANLVVTADNAFEAWVNGRSIGKGNNFTVPYHFDVTPSMRSGTNVLVIEASNGGETPNPAGLIAVLTVELASGRRILVPTDSTWQSRRLAEGNPTREPEAAGAWTTAMDLGPARMEPWSGRMLAPVEAPVFPDATALVSVWSAIGVPPDVESEPRLRATHRQTPEAEIYFVANPQAEAVTSRCTFRVAGRQPEIWDPIDGSRTVVRSFNAEAGRVTLSLALEPHGSRFVIFRGAARRTGNPSHEDGGSRSRVALPLEGPWDVNFESGRGAPANRRWDVLTDWSESGEEGIRFFSGKAVYRTRFTLPADRWGRGQSLALDLGRVEVMARVRLNGRDLGVRWTAPFRYDITAAARSGANDLEITVANLWPNRLIGDQRQPAAPRVTSTTWNPFKAGDLLLPSGLLGPVQIETGASRSAGR